jgi:hypothetical protein
MATDTEAELDNKKRLADVTKKLNKIEADRAWNMSKEGKAANKRLKELQIRIKKENALLDKEAATEDNALKIEEKRADQAAELAKLDADIARAKTSDAAKDRKADRKFEKEQAKKQDKLRNSQRDFGGELYDSIFGTYSLIGSLKNMFPKPVQILAGWGFDKIKKGISQGTKAIGKLAKGGFNALFGKKDSDAPPEVKAAETAAPAEVVPTETITGKKFSDKELAKAHSMGKGAAFGTHPETGEALTEEQSTALKEGGVVPDSVIPQETALGAPAGEEGFVEGIGPATATMFGGGDSLIDGNIGTLLHEDLQAILNELKLFVGPATTEGSIFVHDKSVEDKLEDQKDVVEDQTKELTSELKPEEIDSSKEGEDEQDASLVGKAAGPGGKKKKKGGLLSKLGGGLMAGLGIPAWATDPTMLANMVGGGAKAGMGKLWSGASKVFSNPKFAKIMGPAAIAGGIALMVKDGMAGVEKSEEWGVSKVSGAMGGILGGVDKGFKGAMANMGKWALIGAGIGSIVPVIGTLVGGLIGAVVGAILGWVGGERIAKFFSGVGKWVSEKWNTIKEFPGKVWDAIVNTVKGWLGFGEGKDDELPVKTEGAPKKGWLDTLIDFLIPQWIRDFAKDAVGTVLGWLGLASTDEEGKTEATDMGKKVFGTIGEIGNMFLTIVKKFIPQGLIDFVSNPIDWILKKIGWLDEGGEGTEAGSEAIKVMQSGSIKDKAGLLAGVIAKLIPDALKKIWELGPVDWFLWKIGWKDESGEKTEEGGEAAEILTSGSFGDKAGLIKGVIAKLIPQTLKDIWKMGLVDWFLWKIGWKDEEGAITDEGSKAAKAGGSIRDAVMGKLKAMIASILPEPGGLLGKYVIPDAIYVWAGLKPSKAVMEAEERVEEGKERAGELTTQELGISEDATTARTNIKERRQRQQTQLEANIKEQQDRIARSEAGENEYVGREWKGQEESAAEIEEMQAQLAALDSQEMAALAKVDQEEQEQLAPLQEESVRLQTEMAADEKLIAEGSTTTASAIQNSVPHMRTDIGLAMGLDHTDKLTPGEDIASAANNMYGDNSTSALANVINAPVTNARNSNTTINMPQPRMASDPNTQKQSGYALSGWAKFD